MFSVDISYSCNCCNYVCYRFDDMSNHLISYHPEYYDLGYDKAYTEHHRFLPNNCACPCCYKQLPSIASLHLHLGDGNACRGVPPNTCHYCYDTFSNASQWWKHFAVCTKKKQAEEKTEADIERKSYNMVRDNYVK